MTSIDIENTPLRYDLTGHVALVTGANHGIGASTACALAKSGASVAITYLRLEDPAEYAEPARSNRALAADHVVGVIREHGGRATAIEADLRNPGTPQELFDFAEDSFGPVDILINNATGWVPDTFRSGAQHVSGAETANLTAKTYDEVFSVDARGGALMIAELARRHIARKADWGRIIGLTSGGPLGFPGEVSYGAAKAALENYTMAAAFELSDYGITANIVHPPVTDTGWVNDDVRSVVETAPHLIHVVKPGEVAEVIAYLCSDHARLITGNRVHLR